MTHLPLFPHQSSAVERLAKGEPVYLGFDMGIGKSRTFIEAVKARDCSRVLIICPKSAVLVWKREIAMWDPDASAVVVRGPGDLLKGHRYSVVTHGTMSQREGEVALALTMCAPFDMTAIDEAHGFNAGDTIRTKALKAALPKLGHVVPLSGTPMRNHAGDLYTLLSLCWTGLGKMSRFEFEEQFCQIGSIRVKTRFGTKIVRKVNGSKNLLTLRKLIAPFMLRVRKEDVLKDLPPITWEVVPVDLDHTFISEAELEELEDLIDPENLQGSLGASSDGHLMKLRRLLGLSKLLAAGEYIVDMLDNLPGDRKVLVFAVHQDVVAHLRHHLDEYDPAVITGEVTGKDREAAVAKFLTKPSCRVFIGNIQAAGTALTLVGPNCKCSDVVFVESSWTPMDNAQAACRVHRIGQKDGVVARLLSAAGTVDDLIQNTLARKAGEFTQLFDTKGETK